MIDIVKLANGNVAIYDSTSGDFLRSMSPDVVEIECNEQGEVKVIEDNGNVEYFDPAQVANTQVIPAAAAPFSGDCATLAELLATDFFFVSGGATDAASITYDNSVSGLAATNVQDAIDELALPRFRYPAYGTASFVNGNLIASVSIAADQIRGYLIELRGDAEFTQFKATPAGSAAVGNALFGIYSVNPTTGYPYQRLVQSDNASPFNTNVIAQQTRNLQGVASYKLTKGMYWVCFNASATINWFIFLQSELFQIGYESAAGAVWYGENHVYTGTMPATIAGTGSIGSISNHCPLLLFNTI